MVSAAKLRRAQDRILSARPYALEMLEVLNSLATRADPKAHPLLTVREPRRVEVVVVTADKGLAGAFNANILKEAVSFLEKERDEELDLQVVGRKAREFFRRRRYTITREHVDIFRNLGYQHASAVAKPIMERYINGSLDAVYLEFDYIYEPSAKHILENLVPKHVEYQVWRALLESAAAEQAARMTAMDSATKNATELIDHLTLTMNRVRQASITKEILEVVSGAEALK
jgi:F-type H+-transporting ATPase subunit gamma